MQTVDWYKAAQCAMRNKKLPLDEIAAALAAEQPEVQTPLATKRSYRRWAGLSTNGIASLQADTGWGGAGSADAEMLAIFETREIAEERYQSVQPVTIIVED